MRARVHLSLGWGGEALTIAGSVTAYSRSGVAGPDTRRLRRPLLPVRAGSGGRLLVLVRSPGDGVDRLLQVDPAGGLVGWIDLPESVGGRGVVDFAPGPADGAYVLDDAAGGGRASSARLLRLSGAGGVVWEHPVHRFADTFSVEPLRGRFSRLHAPAAGDLYLSSGYPASGVVALDPSDGAVRAGYEWGEQFEGLTLDEAGHAYYGRRLETSAGTDYVITRRNLRTGKADRIRPPLSGMPGIAAVDRSGRLYLERFDRLTRLSDDGSAEAEVALAGAAVHPNNGHTFLGRPVEEASIAVDQFDGDGGCAGTVSLRWDDARLDGAPRLVAVGGDGTFMVLAGDTLGTPGALARFDEHGALASVRSLDAKPDRPVFEVVDDEVFPLESVCGPAASWAVDDEGRVYLPMADPTGFQLIQLDLS
jgi:hypothetical protein